jgi:hypothetical protein
MQDKGNNGAIDSSGAPTGIPPLGNAVKLVNSELGQHTPSYMHTPIPEEQIRVSLTDR